MLFQLLFFFFFISSDQMIDLFVTSQMVNNNDGDHCDNDCDDGVDSNGNEFIQETKCFQCIGWLSYYLPYFFSPPIAVGIHQVGTSKRIPLNYLKVWSAKQHFETKLAEEREKERILSRYPVLIRWMMGPFVSLSTSSSSSSSSHKKKTNYCCCFNCCDCCDNIFKYSIITYLIYSLVKGYIIVNNNNERHNMEDNILQRITTQKSIILVPLTTGSLLIEKKKVLLHYIIIIC